MGMGMDMGRRVGVVEPLGMPVAIGMGAGMVVTMGVERGGNHHMMLYYNITPVHGPGVIPDRTTCEPGMSRHNCWIPGSPCGRPGTTARP